MTYGVRRLIHDYAWPLVRRRTLVQRYRTQLTDRERALAERILDAEWYTEQYRDLARSKLKPIDHYLQFGLWENRSPSPLFDCVFYLGQRAGQQPRYRHAALVDYVRHGEAIGCWPNPLFDPGWYREAYPESRQVGALMHYLDGAATARPVPEFDSAWFARKYGGQWKPSRSPLAHYLTGNNHRTLMPNALFDPRWYAARYDVPAAMNPLVHYLANHAACGETAP